VKASKEVNEIAKQEDFRLPPAEMSPVPTEWEAKKMQSVRDFGR